MSETIVNASDGVVADDLRDHLREQWPDCDLIVRRNGPWSVFNLPDGAEADAAERAHTWLDSQGFSDPEGEFRQAVENATSIADLKAALLGGNGSPGAEPRRGRPAHAG